MKKNGLLMKAMPLILIVFGFLTLDMFQGYVALTCMLIGIVSKCPKPGSQRILSSR